MHKLVWDTSALLNIKEPNAAGYSPGHSHYADFSGGWIPGPYLNIFPALGYFELQASISRKHREGGRMLREFYLLDEHSIVYPIDQSLIERSNALIAQPGFDKLRGADVIRVHRLPGLRSNRRGGTPGCMSIIESSEKIALLPSRTPRSRPRDRILGC